MNTQIQIREANLSQIRIIKDIAYRTWPDTFKAILTLEQISYMLDRMYSAESLSKQICENGHKFILAVLDNTYLGYASYEISNKPQSTKLHKIYVLPESQGLKLGKRLLSFVEQRASEAGNLYLSLNVNRDNKAIGFYQKKGFEIVGQEDIDIGNGYYMNDYVMNKNLI